MVTPPGRRPSVIVLFTIGLIWIGLRAVYWNGYYTEDSPGYVTDAIYLAVGNYHARHYVNGLNVGTYLPVALPIALFGKSEIALSIWPMMCSLLGVVSLGALAGTLFGWRFGILASFLYSTYPGDIFFSTVVMPDAIQAGWLSFSILLIVVSCTRAPNNADRWLSAGGVAMGVCHLVRANGIILIPIGLCATAILDIVWKRHPLFKAGRDCVMFLSGWALVIALEGLAYLWAAHDPFLRIHVVNGHYGTLGSIVHWGLNTNPRTIPFSIFPPLAWWEGGDWGAFNQDQAYHGLIFCWALASAIAGAAAIAFARQRIEDRAIAGFLMAVCWLAWPLAYHEFGSQSLTHFVPIHRLSRHLVVYAPGAIATIVAGSFLVAAATRSWRSAFTRHTMSALACAALLTHLAANWQATQLAYESYQRIKTTHLRIRAHLSEDVHQIVADPGDLCYFDFWLNPLGQERVRMSDFANYSRCEGLTDGVVLTQSNPGWEGLNAPVIREDVKRLPCLLHPPAHWRLLYDGYPERVYAIQGRLNAQ